MIPVFTPNNGPIIWHHVPPESTESGNGVGVALILFIVVAAFIYLAYKEMDGK